jgi:protein-tyrosine phosphatase
MTKSVLFLCTGNYYRSRLAEELFNHRVRQVSADWQAFSRALAIERGADENIGPISEHTLKALSEFGVPICLPIRSPIACTTEDFERADLIVAMKETEHRALVKQRYKPWEERVIYWNVHDIDVISDTPATAALVGTLVDRLITKLL